MTPFILMSLINPMKAHLALAILLLMELPALEASPEIDLSLPQWVEESSAFNVTLRISGAPEGLARLAVKVLRGEEECLSRVLGLTLSGGDDIVIVQLDPLREPGVYKLSVTLSADNLTISRSEELYIAPSFRSLLQLILKISELDRELTRVEPLIRNATSLELMRETRKGIYENLGNLVKLLVQKSDSKEASLLFGGISNSTDRLAEEVSSMRGYEAFIWSALSQLDSSLKFPAEAKYFWVRLLPALLLLIVLLMVLFPLYTTDYSELVSYLVSEDGSIDAREELLLGEVRRRAEEIMETTKEEIESSKNLRNYFTMILASFLASVGLMANNVTAIIGSMFLSSLMGVIVASSMNIAIYRSEDTEPLNLFYIGIKGALLGISVVILSSAAIALIGSSFIPLQATQELMARSSPNLSDLMIALCAGTAGALSLIHRGEIGALVGSAIAIALVPPAATVGISLAMMDPYLLSGAIFLLTVNVLALIASGYLSAKVYVIAPILRCITGVEDRNIVSGMISLLSAWAKLVIGLAGGGSLRDSLIGMLRRVSSIALLPLIALLLAILTTTEFASLLSSVHSSILSLISSFPNFLALQLSLPRWAPLLLSSTLALLLTTMLMRKLSDFRKGRSYRSLVEIALLSILVWLDLGYVIGIHLLSSIAAIFSISLVLALLVSMYRPLWEKKTLFAVRLFIVLTLTVLLVNSASIFSETSVRQRIYSSGFIELSKTIISSYAGVLPEDVTVGFEGSDTVRAVVRIDPMRLEGLKEVKGIEKLIGDSLREASGSDVRVGVEFIVKPP